MRHRAENRQRRISLLTTLLTWEGRLNNARLRELFDINPIRASEWIRLLRDEKPDWMTLDSKDRSYRATSLVYWSGRKERLSPNETAASLAAYVNLVGLPSYLPDMSDEHALCAACPDISPPKPEICAVVSEAVRAQRSVGITYRSMREPLPHKRTISPHSIVRAGRRWHVRAFCLESEGFRDYAFGRIVDAEILPHLAEVTKAADKAWATMVPVRLMAHPLLTLDQQDVIRFEYFGKAASRVTTCRGPLVAYYIQDVRAALDAEQQRPPDYQLAVSNIEMVRPWVFPS